MKSMNSLKNSWIVVTGAAGFIGSQLVRGLNAQGYDRILAVDAFRTPGQFKNLVGCQIADCWTAQELRTRLEKKRWTGPTLRAVFHQGACSDTLEMDMSYVLDNNHRYTQTLIEACQRWDVPCVYASSAAVYGAGRAFRESPECESPLNPYAYSKYLTDCWVRSLLSERTTRTRAAPLVGLRYFNVYGPGESHKGRMASVAYHHFHQYAQTGHVELFEGCQGYANGEQQRDFVWVGDIVKINLFFLEHPECSGIYNAGTGHAQSFNDIAVNVVRSLSERPETALSEACAAGTIRYIPFPVDLANRYQAFTQADITALRQAGYTERFLSLSEAIPLYKVYLQEQAELPSGVSGALSTIEGVACV